MGLYVEMNMYHFYIEKDGVDLHSLMEILLVLQDRKAWSIFSFLPGPGVFKGVCTV